MTFCPAPMAPHRLLCVKGRSTHHDDNLRNDRHTSTIKYTCTSQSPTLRDQSGELTCFNGKSELPLHEVNEQITTSTANTPDYIEAIQEGGAIADGTGMRQPHSNQSR